MNVSNSAASEINRMHDRMVVLAREGLHCAIEIGRLLEEQKAALKHGEWLPWLRVNVTFSTQTADRYRAVYRQREKFLTVGNLSLTEAYRLAGVGPRKGLTSAAGGGDPEWIETAVAFREIRDGKLYRETHKTFEAYCKEKWGLDPDLVAVTLQAMDSAIGERESG